MVISKMDLLPHVPFSVDAAEHEARDIQPVIDILRVSTITGEGIASWCEYLEHKRNELVASEDEQPVAR